MCVRRLSCLLLVTAAGVLPAASGQWVEFEDGRLLEVSSVSVADGVATLEMRGGGRIAIPAGRIRGVGDAATAGIDGADAWRGVAGPYAEMIAEVADEHRIDPALLASVATVESGWDPAAVSPKGAQGLLQLMPQTAKRFGVRDVFEPEQNVRGGAAYLRWLLDRYQGDTRLALAAYNAGEGAVDRHQGIPPYRETKAYVSRVMQGFEGFAAAP